MRSQDLRTRAEAALRMSSGDFSALAALDAEHVLYELQIHQVELEMQNETLRCAQLDVEGISERYQRLFDHAPVGYLMLDDTGIIKQANAASLSLLGATRPRLVGQPFAASVAGPDLAVLDRLLHGITPGARASWEVRLRPSKNGATHVRIDTSTIANLAGCLVVLTDISERVRNLEAEQRLHLEREADLAGRIAELESRNRVLEGEIARRTKHETQRLHEEGRTRDADRLQSLGMLAAGIAHDFNNLLVGVLGNADLLLQTPELPEAWRDPLVLIKRAARSASDLTRQLLVFAGMGRLSLTPLSFERVVREALELLRTDLPSGIELQCSLDGDLGSIMADRGQVQQVVINLVTNAIEAVGGRGKIQIRLKQEHLDTAALEAYQPGTDAMPGGYVLLHVSDDGPGIDAATQARIFDPFFTTKFTGRGLGLATALGIVQSHHGALRVRSTPGRGATFDVAFPVSSKQPKSERPVAMRDAEWVGSGSVLLIDDEPVVRQVVSKFLERMGFEVTAADSGASGLEKYRSSARPFDLVVLDWLMPGVSGEQVLRALREADPDLAVVLISGFSIEDLAVYDKRAARVQKPMSLGDLRAAVRTLMETKQVRVFE